MDDKGVYAIARSLWDNPDFAAEEYSQREAWMWLIGAAAWKAMKVRGSGGGPVSLERGEFTFSVRFLAEKWSWSKSRVGRFICMLENRDMIRDTGRDGSAVFNIIKYNDFQVVGLPKRDSTRDTSRDDVGTAAGQQRDKEETLKHSNIKAEEESRAPQAAFSKPTQPKGARWPADQEIPAEWFTFVEESLRELGRAPLDLRLEAAKFVNYWASKTGANSTKLDWKKTFLTWCLNARPDQRSFAEQRFDNLKTGARRAAFVDGERGQGVETPSSSLVRLALPARNG